MEKEVFEGYSDGTPKAEYADCFRIGYSAHKFVLDFSQMSHQGKGNMFHTRVVTGPDTAKVLVESLRRSIKEYEEKFGRINPISRNENL